jgi:hypothetical protein
LFPKLKQNHLTAEIIGKKDWFLIVRLSKLTLNYNVKTDSI